MENVSNSRVLSINSSTAVGKYVHFANRRHSISYPPFTTLENGRGLKCVLFGVILTSANPSAAQQPNGQRAGRFHGIGDTGKPVSRQCSNTAPPVTSRNHVSMCCPISQAADVVIVFRISFAFLGILHLIRL